MRILKYSLLIVMLGLSVEAFPQHQDTVKIIRRSSGLYLSYNSSLIYPGVRAGLELPVETIRFDKLKASGEKKYFVRDRYITINMGWYHHPEFHDNLYLTGGWTMRRTNDKGFFTEFSPEAGFSRTFLGGTTYVVDNNGNVSIRKLAGYFYGLVSVGGGLGYNLEKVKKIPLSVFSKLNLLLMFPYNSTIYLRPALEIGVIYRPVNFLKMRVKSKNRMR
ncbi:MAG: hypothetical protein IH595_14875 [Bacteroidales bacterium]|nr:hypothetical protein [Bacteroidales bacterium]